MTENKTGFRGQAVSVIRQLVVVAITLGVLTLLYGGQSAAQAERDQAIREATELQAQYSAATACLLTETEARTPDYARECFALAGLPAPVFPGETP